MTTTVIKAGGLEPPTPETPDTPNPLQDKDFRDDP
jgi:hypothetical protein